MIRHTIAYVNILMKIILPKCFYSIHMPRFLIPMYSEFSQPSHLAQIDFERIHIVATQIHLLCAAESHANEHEELLAPLPRCRRGTTSAWPGLVG